MKKLLFLAHGFILSWMGMGLTTDHDPAYYSGRQESDMVYAKRLTVALGGNVSATPWDLYPVLYLELCGPLCTIFWAP